MTDAQMFYDPVLKRLNFKGATSFPEEIFEYANELEILDLSNGSLTSLPQTISKLSKLRVLFLSNNDFEEIPQSLFECKNLEMIGLKSCRIREIPDNAFPQSIRGVTLTDNIIEKISPSIGSYKNLQKLMLAGNVLDALPEELLGCENLQLLRIANNRLNYSPEWLFQLPKLGWYADAANPYQQNDRKFLQNVKEVSWNSLQLGEKIGESAINTVYKAHLQGQSVAVKIYGAGITTDGLPIDDMNACLAVGTHPHLIGAIGRLVGAPENAQGLIMPLISDEYSKLGMPPDLYTLTRDVFEKEFELSCVLQVLKDVTSALAHCHNKGVMHGDVYAHNILSNSKGESYIGDFGAASIYEPGSKLGYDRELVDVAGFGYLIDDLLRCSSFTSKKLTELKDRCLNSQISQRPAFIEVEKFLGGV